MKKRLYSLFICFVFASGATQALSQKEQQAIERLQSIVSSHKTWSNSLSDVQKQSLLAKIADSAVGFYRFIIKSADITISKRYVTDIEKMLADAEKKIVAPVFKVLCFFGVNFKNLSVVPEIADYQQLDLLLLTREVATALEFTYFPIDSLHMSTFRHSYAVNRIEGLCEKIIQESPLYNQLKMAVDETKQSLEFDEKNLNKIKSKVAGENNCIDLLNSICAYRSFFIKNAMNFAAEGKLPLFNFVGGKLVALAMTALQLVGLRPCYVPTVSGESNTALRTIVWALKSSLGLLGVPSFTPQSGLTTDEIEKEVTKNFEIIVKAYPEKMQLLIDLFNTWQRVNERVSVSQREISGLLNPFYEEMDRRSYSFDEMIVRDTAFNSAVLKRLDDLTYSDQKLSVDRIRSEIESLIHEYLR